MLEFLLVTIIVLSTIMICLLVFIWNQFNNTDSKLVKLIEARIKLNNVHYELDRLEFPIIEEKSCD